MSSELSAIPPARRRRVALLTAVFAVLLIAVGIVPWTAHTSSLVRVLAVVAIVAGVIVGLIAWGLLQSSIDDERRQAAAELDAVLIETAGELARCHCGEVHDPDELHIVDACEHDGVGTACERNCESCVLASPQS